MGLSSYIRFRYDIIFIYLLEEVSKMKISIGEMSKLHNVSIHTLRYYDKIGLLLPSEVNPDSKYRYYNENDCCKLSKIKVLKTLGLPISKIKVLLEGSLIEAEESLMEIHKELLLHLNTLNEVEAFMQEQLLQISKFKTKDYYNEPALINFKSREGYLIDVTDDSSTLDRVKAIEDFNKINDTNCDIFLKPSRLISIDEYKNRTLQNYLALKRGKVTSDSYELFTLKSGPYAVIDHIGPTNNIEKSYEKLFQFIKSSNLNHCGQAIEELIINSDLTSNPMEWRTQIQIPITFN